MPQSKKTTTEAETWVSSPDSWAVLLSDEKVKEHGNALGISGYALHVEALRILDFNFLPPKAGVSLDQFHVPDIADMYPELTDAILAVRKALARKVADKTKQAVAHKELADHFDKPDTGAATDIDEPDDWQTVNQNEDAAGYDQLLA